MPEPEWQMESVVSVASKVSGIALQDFVGKYARRREEEDFATKPLQPDLAAPR